MLHPGRGLGGTRAARRAMHHYYLVGGNSGNSGSGGTSSQTPSGGGVTGGNQPSAVAQTSSGRESESRDVDSIADILSQLSGVQRGSSSGRKQNPVHTLNI